MDKAFGFYPTYWGFKSLQAHQIRKEQVKNALNCTTLQDAMRVGMLPRVTVKMLMERFSMSRSTANRWVNHWKAAKGVHDVIK